MNKTRECFETCPRCGTECLGYEVKQVLAKVTAERDEAKTCAKDWHQTAIERAEQLQQCRQLAEITTAELNALIKDCSAAQVTIAGLQTDKHRMQTSLDASYRRAESAESRARELEDSNEHLLAQLEGSQNRLSLSQAREVLYRSALASSLPAEQIDTESAMKIIATAVEGEYKTDALRYQRLRIVGVAPYGTPHLEAGRVLRFTNLDEFVDGRSAALAQPQPSAQPQVDKSKCLAESVITGKQEWPRCEQYPDCVCGGPQADHNPMDICAWSNKP